MREPGWRTALAALVVVRVAIPLAVLAAAPAKLPALPRIRFGVAAGCPGAREPWTGDACAYYSTARALVSVWAPGLAVAALVAIVAALAYRRRRPPRHLLVVGVALGLAAAAAVAIARLPSVAAGAVGWPLLWSLPLLPLRVFDAAGPTGAFAGGLVLSLAANAVTVVASAYAGLHATGRRSVGLAAGAFFALWPLLVVAVAGTRSWGNGTWEVDAGLHMYTEPVSTALVTTALALLLAPGLSRLLLVLAGVALGCSVAVRPTNALAALVALALAARLAGRRGASLLLAGALTLAPVVIAFWPKKRGYELRPVNDTSGVPLFGARYAGSTWLHSLLWTPRTLIVLVPLAIVGALALRRRDAALALAAFALANAAIYTFAHATAEHPRYLFASLPALLVLWCAGAAAVAGTAYGFCKKRGLIRIRRV